MMMGTTSLMIVSITNWIQRVMSVISKTCLNIGIALFITECVCGKGDNEMRNKNRSAPECASGLQSVPLLTDLRARLLGVVAGDAEDVVGRRARAQPPGLARRLLWLGRRRGCFGHHWRRQRDHVGHTRTRARRHEGRHSRGDEVVTRPAHGAVLVRGVAAVGFAVASLPLQSKGHVRSRIGTTPRL